MCKFGQYLHTSRKSGRNVYAICVGWVNFVHSLHCLLKNLRSQQKFYATAGPTGPDKYELWTVVGVFWLGRCSRLQTKRDCSVFSTSPQDSRCKDSLGNVFSSLKERDDALDLQGSHAAASILLLNNPN